MSTVFYIILYHFVNEPTRYYTIYWKKNSEMRFSQDRNKCQNPRQVSHQIIYWRKTRNMRSFKGHHVSKCRSVIRRIAIDLNDVGIRLLLCSIHQPPIRTLMRKSQLHYYVEHYQEFCYLLVL